MSFGGKGTSLQSDQDRGNTASSGAGGRTRGDSDVLGYLTRSCTPCLGPCEGGGGTGGTCPGGGDGGEGILPSETPCTRLVFPPDCRGALDHRTCLEECRSQGQRDGGGVA